METLLIYLLKVILCSAVLYGYYFFFLRNRHFHRYNRFYLLSVVLVSSVVPALRVPFLFPQEEATPAFIYKTLEVIVVNGGEEETTLWHNLVRNPLLSLGGLAFLVYCTISSRRILHFLLSLRAISRIRKRYTPETMQDIHLYQTSEPGTPFSFFKDIFWNKACPLDSDKGQQLFRHELFHVKQLHSFDNVLMELATALFWINPFFHLIRRELHTIHEFLSDEYASSGSNRYAYAEILLMHAIQEKKRLPMVHYFFHSPIKRRIAMILQTSSHTRFSYLRRVMILPIAVILSGVLVLRAQKSVQSLIPSITADHSDVPPSSLLPAEEPLTVVIDAGHGGTDKGASGNNRYEKDLTLSIAGKVKELSGKYNLNVLLTRSDDTYPSLKDRTAFTESQKAQVFISLHIGSEPVLKNGQPVSQGQRRTGFDAFVSQKNKTFEQENILLGSAILQKLGQVYTASNSLQTRNVGIWVLDASPCPSLLLECGYITNSKDVAFISDPTNQEKIAARILEGIVAYSRKEVINKAPVRHISATSSTMNDASRAQDSSIAFIRHMNKNIRYPALAIKSHFGGSVYLKLSKGKDGSIGNAEVLKKLPANVPASGLKEIVVVGYAPATPPTPIQHEKGLQALSDEVEQTVKKYERYSNNLANASGTVYYKISFRTEPSAAEQNTAPEIVFTLAEIESSFKGGPREWARYLNQTLRYPEAAVQQGLQGTAVIRFIVTKDGDVKDAEIVEDPGGGLGEEALRIIKNSSFKWNPAIQNGHAVHSYKKQPITFRLEPS